MSEIIVELLDELRGRGVAVRVEGGELLIKDPGGKVTKGLRKKLRRHKSEVITQITIDEVARPGAHKNRRLNDDEFTEKYLILMKAWRTGFIDTDMKDSGLDFLLGNWKINPALRQ